MTVCTGRFEMPDSYAADFIPGIRQGTAVSLPKVIPTKGVTFDRNTQMSGRSTDGAASPGSLPQIFTVFFFAKPSQTILFIHP